MVANCYSKAVLRAVAEAVRLQNAFVDYFPSYESVTLSDRGAALQADNVHPTDEIIRVNTSRMVRAYVDADAIQVDEIREAIAENPLSAVSLLESRPQLVENDPQLAVALLNAAAKTGRTDLVALALPHVGDLLTAAERDLAAARVALAGNDPSGALALLGELPSRRSEQASYWGTKLNAEIALDELNAGRQTVEAWSAAFPRAAEPYRLLAQAYAARGEALDAAAMFDAMLALTDDDPRALLDYGGFLIEAGRCGDACELLDKVRPVNPAQAERLARLRRRLPAEVSGELRLGRKLKSDAA
jgi:tetratricopeptide (TPR) repeat protein